MAWYDRGRKKKSKSQQSQHTVTCVRCGKEHPALDNTWICNGRGDILCYGTEESCFNVLFELSKKANREGQARKSAEGEMESNTRPPEGW